MVKSLGIKLLSWEKKVASIRPKKLNENSLVLNLICKYQFELRIDFS